MITIATVCLLGMMIQDTSRPVPYLYADVPPKYPGLKQFVDEHLRWPKEEVDFSGTIIASFVVEENGAVSHVTIEKGGCEPCNRGCIQMIALMKKWVPGKVNGKPVRTSVMLPVSFTLRE